LVLVSSTTIGTAVSSVVVNNAFSATYDSYKIIVSGGTGSTNSNLNFRFGSSTTGYAHWGFYQSNYSAGAPGYVNNTNGSVFPDAAHYSGNSIWGTMDVISPYQTKYTTFTGSSARDDICTYINGIHKVASSFTDFTLITAVGTVTGGTIQVYGYKK
jgi:hypothetical protein